MNGGRTETLGLNKVISKIQGQISELYRLDDETWETAIANKQRIKALEEKAKQAEKLGNRLGRRRAVVIGGLAGFGYLAYKAWTEKKEEEQAKQKAQTDNVIEALRLVQEYMECGEDDVVEKEVLRSKIEELVKKVKKAETDG